MTIRKWKHSTFTPQPWYLHHGEIIFTSREQHTYITRKPRFHREKTIFPSSQDPGLIYKAISLQFHKNKHYWLSIIYSVNSLRFRYTYFCAKNWENTPFSVLNKPLLIYRRFSIIVNTKKTINNTHTHSLTATIQNKIRQLLKVALFISYH